MKKLIALVCLIAGSFPLFSQDRNTAIKAKEIVWFGMDFSKAKFVGVGEATGYEMRAKYIPAWNNLILAEQKKFDVKKAFKKDNVYFDIASVNEINIALKEDAMMSPNSYKLDRSEVDGLIRNYKSTEKKEGVGVAFIIESFDKPAVNASAYVVFFDIASKKVLLCEKVQGKPAGIGVRNYWAGAIKAMLTLIEESDLSSWK
jgi:hypothetical protein